jgi:uncharacterized protein (DUF1800 family)
MQINALGETPMARDPNGAALALHRFGFGPRPGSIDAVASDPQGALLAELERPDAGRILSPNLPSAAESNRAVFDYNAERNANAKREQIRREAALAAGGQPESGNMAAVPAGTPLPQQIFLTEARARADTAIYAEIGYVERLVWFWSNHFCVNANATAMAGGYEREAIRPHVLGRFAEMLLAAESHPAMLIYLDNARSIGPDSVAGVIRDKGLNENLAREILELHTLGVRTVYTQSDVVSLAKVLTGWTILPTASNPEHGGEFVFLGRAHEPGAQTVIGKTYPDRGMEQGKAVLADLASRPDTARHVALKLARHFVADDPPPALVERLERRFLETGGDLKEIARALVTAPESWMPERAKIKRPGEWVTAALRATEEPVDIRRIMQAQTLLGEPLWRPPAPKGFPDDNAAWLDGLAERLDVAGEFAQSAARDLDPQAVADTALGPLASAETRRAVANAASKSQGLTFLLMAPEFQRR